MKIYNLTLAILLTIGLNGCGSATDKTDNKKVDNVIETKSTVKVDQTKKEPSSSSNEYQESGSKINSKSTTYSKYDIQYDGLLFYAKEAQRSNYGLEQLDDDDFNQLTDMQKLRVANRLLGTMFFGYGYQDLKQKIDNGDFISSTFENLSKEKTDKGWLESYILDEKYFSQTHTEKEILNIFTRFYIAKDLDRYFFNNWIAYTLTQTIMFSPAYELDSSHYPNIAGVYNRLVALLEDEATLRYITYRHTISEDNWRRFRSPEDNGREMLEIYTSDINDSKVPLAAKALQNWKLDRDYDTLVVSLNMNTEPIKLFDTTIYNGNDFYTQMVQSQPFIETVVGRLVNYFFADSTTTKIAEITKKIVDSKPKLWQDIFKQIVFSKEYLLNSSRVKTAEENFFSFMKKTAFQYRKDMFHGFEVNLRRMHQASMKYKLGKTSQVPLDTLSFISYHKFVREEMLLRNNNVNHDDMYDAWDRQGWRDSFIDNSNFYVNFEEEEKTLESLINYLFKVLLYREASSDEMNMFKNHILDEQDGAMVFNAGYDIFSARKYREQNKRQIVKTVLDYISRLDQFYIYEKVTK